ncbi:type II toxin-antitoxin system RelE family toxin [Pseudohalioglobus lutimaris]|uniref:Type II toxin-antitoxin system mRNA interferase toxin, RelE/StbE family n=1 Tax=Pseudohalioglobus lutimaris TaxID=1737061 RepID=A0A2N5X002_9GAMM|nr:type II toxin-antitoxin system RelE/ParE family toxin [Pseudohalioglobus lutimaris]PLW67811.1 type II toxin-antitoxin system mRNA interferase toxin, RelE/StbE family [Pseudohalioglobus lutimaris]
MTYRLLFRTEAKKEWDKLDAAIRSQFKKKLIERLEEPRVESARLSGLRDCYKIKLRSAGYRLVYQVRDAEIVVSVVAVGKRERNAVYKAAVKRV